MDLRERLFSCPPSQRQSTITCNLQLSNCRCIDASLASSPPLTPSPLYSVPSTHVSYTLLVMVTSLCTQHLRNSHFHYAHSPCAPSSSQLPLALLRAAQGQPMVTLNPHDCTALPTSPLALF